VKVHRAVERYRLLKTKL